MYLKWGWGMSENLATGSVHCQSVIIRKCMWIIMVTKRLTSFQSNAGFRLEHRQRRWSNLKPALIQCLQILTIMPVCWRVTIANQGAVENEMKWNESGFRPPLCTYRLNWARRTSWGWWDDWDDTVLQTQDSKFEPWRSEAEHATSRPRRLPTILTFTRGWGRNIFVSFKPPRPGNEPRTLAWKAAVLTTTLGPPP